MDTQRGEKHRDLVGIGECLVEFTSVGNGLYRLGYSGDVLNALSSAGRLAMRTGLISATGDDPFGPGLRDILQGEKIDLTYTPILSGRPNGVYFSEVDENAAPHFHFLRKNSAATEAFVAQPLDALIRYVRESKALLLSSIPLAVMQERGRIIELLRAVKGETAICFDLNFRGTLWHDANDFTGLFGTLADCADVLFVTNDDDKQLFGVRTPEEAVRDYLRRGFRRVAYRRGAEKTVVGDATGASPEIFEVPVPTVRMVVDTTGAGDVFNAGFIAAMLRHHETYECAAMGNAAAACSVETRGGRGTGVSIERVEKHYRPLVKWGTFHVPPHR